MGVPMSEIDVNLSSKQSQHPNLTVVEIKAFIPAKNFALSMEFYEALAFTRASVFEDIAYFHCGNSSFLLQDFFVQEHAANYQMHLLVENFDAWHERAKVIPDRFKVKIGELENQPWAMRDFTLFDPSGVLWRIAQNIPKKG
jgi:Glyoxalase/Bleomycin resistance protein/Dioxygenase superfamily